jgi:hypothetical protein
MLKLETRADLQRLVDEGLQETLSLEYKASPALARQSQPVDELCKDISAMANSIGGQIIYGIEEDRVTHKPKRIDEGVMDPKITREWIEQVILSRVQPRIQKLSIDRIPIDATETAFAFVLSVEQTTTGPHQAPDKKYHRRYELSAVPMEDYEVRDIMRRATTPELYVRLSFAAGMTAPLEYADQTEVSKPIILEAFIGNRSTQPAFFTLIKLGIDTDIPILSHGVFQPMGQRTDADGIPLNWVIHAKTAPPNMPVFKEVEFFLTSSDLTLGYHSRLLGGDRRFRVTTSVQTPGFTLTENWTIHYRANTLRLLEPGHPLSR